MQPFVTLIGLDESMDQRLDDKAWQCLCHADHIFGGSRHLALLGSLAEQAGHALAADKHVWTNPFQDNLAVIDALRDQKVVVLATGDPFHYGVGTTIVRELGEAVIADVFAAQSSIALCCARMRWAQEDVAVVSLHGRDRASLVQMLAPRRRIIVLSADETTPERIGETLRAHGLEQTALHVFSRMGHADERHDVWVADEPQDQSVVDRLNRLNVVAFTCPAPDAFADARAASLDDDAFDHDGQMTKSSIRAITVAQLRPFHGAILWDIGAGSGAVSIAFALQAGKAKVYAIESRKDRIANIATNVQRYQLPDYHIVEGRAPDALTDLPVPDVVFIGGGLTTSGVFEAAWHALRPGGFLVANAVTLESEEMLLQLGKRPGARLSRLSLQHAEKVGPYHGWRPFMPVTQLVMRKDSTS